MGSRREEGRFTHLAQTQTQEGEEGRKGGREEEGKRGRGEEGTGTGGRPGLQPGGNENPLQGATRPWALGGDPALEPGGNVALGATRPPPQSVALPSR